VTLKPVLALRCAISVVRHFFLFGLKKMWLGSLALVSFLSFQSIAGPNSILTSAKACSRHLCERAYYPASVVSFGIGAIAVLRWCPNVPLSALGSCISSARHLHNVWDIKGNFAKEPNFFVHWNAVRTIVESEDFRVDLNAFDRFLIEAKAAEETHKNSRFSSVWDWALDRFKGDTQRAFKFLMVFTLDTTASSYRSYDPSLQGFFQAWGSVQAVKTRSYETAPSSIHFPNGDNNERFPQPYHYWSAAYISSELLSRGSEPISAAFIGSLTGIIYECLLFRMSALRLMKDIDKNFRQALAAVPLTDHELASLGWEGTHDNLRGDHVYSHIAYHIVGALHGALRSSEHLPSIPSVTQFVAANYGSLRHKLYPFLRAHFRSRNLHSVSNEYRSDGIAQSTGDRDAGNCEHRHFREKTHFD
jgi:hypothetical protein